MSSYGDVFLQAGSPSPPPSPPLPLNEDSSDDTTKLVSWVPDEVPPTRANLRHLLANSAAWWVAAMLVFVACFCISSRVWLRALPNAKLVDAPLDQFSEGRARLLISNVLEFGTSRYAGTTELVNTSFLLVQELTDIQTFKTNPLINIDFVYLNTHGSNSPFTTTVWQDYPLIAVRLSSNETSNSSVVLSSHIDSAIESPGVSDNLVGAAVVIELLRVIANTPNFVLKIFNYSCLWSTGRRANGSL